MKDLLHDFGTWLLAFVISLVPAGLGAVVSLLVEAGLTWGQRITQVWVGIVVSYFVTNAANALFGLHPLRSSRSPNGLCRAPVSVAWSSPSCASSRQTAAPPSTAIISSG